MTVAPLGSGEVTVAVRSAATGRTRPIDAAITDGTYIRGRNVTTVATLTTPKDCGPLCAAEEWADELVILRDGGVVWGPGPIIGKLDDPNEDTITVSAYDRSVWWFGPATGERVIYRPDLVDGLATPLGLWQTVIGHAEECGPVGLEYIYVDGGPVSTFSVTPRLGDLIRTVLDQISTLGLNWTVVGTRCLVGEGPPVDETPLLAGAEWHPAPVTQVDGFGLATYVVARNGDSSIVGVAGDPCATAGVDGRQGVHHRTLEIAELASNRGAEQVAASYLAAHSEVNRLVVTGQGGLASDTTLTMDDLIPGRQWRMATEPSCVTVGGNQSLDTVTVVFEGGRETAVAVDLRQSNSNLDRRA